jgi:predicted nucleic acid-binding protein
MPDNHKIRKYLKNIETEFCVSAISKIEVLGFHKLSNDEKELFRKFFTSVRIIPLDNSIVDAAINIRQNKKVSLGDSIIAATALVHDKKLFTNNEDDFEEIAGIEILTMKSILS